MSKDGEKKSKVLQMVPEAEAGTGLVPEVEAGSDLLIEPEDAAECAKKEKEKKIKREMSRLKKVFKDLDKNKLQTVESLIKNAAFMAVSLEELQEIINREGYIVEYQNGEHQTGTRQSDAVKTHIAMTKNHASVIKQLCDLVPAERRKASKLQSLRDS